MLQRKPRDQNVPIFQQISTDLSPVVLVIVFQVAAEDNPALLTAVEGDLRLVCRKPQARLV